MLPPNTREDQKQIERDSSPVRALLTHSQHSVLALTPGAIGLAIGFPARSNVAVLLQSTPYHARRRTTPFAVGLLHGLDCTDKQRKREVRLHAVDKHERESRYWFTALATREVHEPARQDAISITDLG